MRKWIMVGAASGGISVACGAFAAHGLVAQVSEYQHTIFETGARYQMYHALALLAVGLLGLQTAGDLRASQWINGAGWSFLIGTLFFSGSLYWLALNGNHILVFVTPIGGVAFLIGWLSLARAAWKLPPSALS